MNILNELGHLKLIFPFLEYRDILSLLCSSHIIYDSLICETRQITISSKGLLKLLQDPSFFLGKIVDPSKQLSIVFDDEREEDEEGEDEEGTEHLELSGGKEALLQSVKPSFPYFLITPEANFPSLQKLTCVPIFFIYLCEVYPGFTVRKLEILEDLNESLASYLSPHVGRVLEDLDFRSWPSEVEFPRLSPTLQSLRLERSAVSSFPPHATLKHLRLEECQNSELDLTLYDLETLELFYPSEVDFALVNGCKRLVVHSPDEVKNMAKAKLFEQIEFTDIDTENLPVETLQNIRVLRLAYSEPEAPVSINLSSFKIVELFELTGFGSEEADALVTLRVNEIAPSNLKVVHLSDFRNAVNLSWFSHVREISLENCSQVTSLLGLEKVSRVILRCLPLESLEGLGGNAYVEVYGCESLGDFSALKYVQEVKIEHCIGFQNASDVGYVQKLSIIGCVQLEDLSELMDVKELYLDHCDNVVPCASLDKIPKVSIHRCKKLRRVSKILLDFGFRDLGTKDGFSSLPDSLHLEILKYLQDWEIRSTISCNTHFYQRYSKLCSSLSSTSTGLAFRDRPYTIVNTSFENDELQVPSIVKAIHFEFCSFSRSPNFGRGLKRLEFNACSGLTNITDFSVAEEVIIRQVSSDDSLNLASLNRVKRLTLDECDIINDYSPLQDTEQITVKHYSCGSNIEFKGSKSFSNSKMIKLYFEFFIGIEIDLAFYKKVEIFHLSGGGDFNCSGSCPVTLRKLYLSRLKRLTLPSGLDHLHLLHISDCSGFTSLKGLGSIPNIRLSYLCDLKSLEGLGPGNEFVQLLYLDEVEDFSAVSGCRKVVIWGCPKFKDASAFAESNYVVIGECGNLVDVSMLGKVKHLELIGCKNIWSLKGLEGVKELKVWDCRLLENQNNTRDPSWTICHDDEYF